MSSYKYDIQQIFICAWQIIYNTTCIPLCREWVRCVKASGKLSEGCCNAAGHWTCTPWCCITSFTASTALFQVKPIRGSWMYMVRLARCYWALVLKVHSLLQQRVWELPQSLQQFTCASILLPAVQFCIKAETVIKTTVQLSFSAAMSSVEF